MNLQLGNKIVRRDESPRNTQIHVAFHFFEGSTLAAIRW